MYRIIPLRVLRRTAGVKFYLLVRRESLEYEIKY